ncbi:hypothetical protein [Dehalobacter sp. TBBPA1]|uniref:hypothetical protein n=1 Tax=Dehalobacter sp. TBBPA1 TaxID=3235037 RepID=UPI0034A32176
MKKVELENKRLTDGLIVPLLLCTAFSLFLFNESARSFLGNGILNTYFNIFFLLFGITLIVIFLIRQCLDLRIILLTFSFIGMALILLKLNGRNLLQQIVLMTSMGLPFLITAIRIPEAIFKPLCEKFIKSINLICLLLMLTALLDYMSGSAIQLFLAKHYFFDNDQINLVLSAHARGEYRYYSIVGHPLVVSWYFLAYYMLNILYNRYFKPISNEYVVTLVTLIGLVLCASRTAIIIAVIMIIFLNNRTHKILYFILFSIFGLLGAINPITKEVLIKRFMAGLSSSDYSGGRNSAFILVLKHYVDPPSWIMGGGLGYSRQITMMMGGFINSFEYPMIMFAYDFSIIGAIIIYLVIFVSPIYVFIKNKTFFFIPFFILISFYMNGFNVLANYSDHMGQFCFIIMILVNFSYFIKSRCDGEMKNEKSNYI